MSERFREDDVARQLDNCTFCPKMCRHACPVSTASGRETWIPQAKMDALNRLRRGNLGWSAEAADPLWACTGCRHCTVYCEHDNEPGLVLFAGRAQAVSRSAGHPALDGYPQRFRNREERLARHLREAFPDRLAAEGAIGFLPGCDGIDKGAGDIAAALALFESVGAEVSLVDAPQVCGGYPLLAAGHPDLFRWHASKVAAALRRFSTVVVNCSACLYSIQRQYPGEGITFTTRIVSLAELLAEHRARLPKPTQRRTVYYHDPCYLARYNAVIEQPRQVLSTIAEVRELGWSKTDGECCGGAGLLPKTMPNVADAMARRRLAEVAQQGGGLVATSCATCAFMLKRNAPVSVEVVDLPTAVAQLGGVPFTAPSVASGEAEGD